MPKSKLSSNLNKIIYWGPFRDYDTAINRTLDKEDITPHEDMIPGECCVYGCNSCCVPKSNQTSVPQPDGNGSFDDKLHMRVGFMNTKHVLGHLFKCHPSDELLNIEHEEDLDKVCVSSKVEWE